MLEALYTDRVEAGRKLAHKLSLRGVKRADLVLALPRGGVPIGFEVARALGAELDVMLVRKLGVPGHEELAMGAISLGGVRVLNPDVIDLLGIDDDTIEEVARREQIELERRALRFRGTTDPPEVRGRRVLVVDDGVATGSTMRVALHALRPLEPAELIVATPVAPRAAIADLEADADLVVIDATPEPFFAVGTWYLVFRQVSDDEVEQLLSRFRSQRRRAPAAQPMAQ